MINQPTPSPSVERTDDILVRLFKANKEAVGMEMVTGVMWCVALNGVAAMMLTVEMVAMRSNDGDDDVVSVEMRVLVVGYGGRIFGRR
uniref:Transmembrane protein n=1 Tax=Tanacetum cinerariifolium TaxID=118510 RepID=A0A699IIX0_TANCI|nr:hypothetical protein [Tanacetum cinerariifolium]